MKESTTGLLPMRRLHDDDGRPLFAAAVPVPVAPRAAKGPGSFQAAARPPVDPAAAAAAVVIAAAAIGPLTENLAVDGFPRFTMGLIPCSFGSRRTCWDRTDTAVGSIQCSGINPMQWDQSKGSGINPKAVGSIQSSGASSLMMMPKFDHPRFTPNKYPPPDPSHTFPLRTRAVPISLCWRHCSTAPRFKGVNRSEASSRRASACSLDQTGCLWQRISRENDDKVVKCGQCG